MVAGTLCPTLGAGNVLYGSMDITYYKWFGYIPPPQPPASVKLDPEHCHLVSPPPQIIIIQ